MPKNSLFLLVCVFLSALMFSQSVIIAQDDDNNTIIQLTDNDASDGAGSWSRGMFTKRAKYPHVPRMIE